MPHCCDRLREQPTKAVTFVSNHDAQPLQSLESPVDPWFKPHAYAIILLRAEGYPCVFLTDYDGTTYEDKGIRLTMPCLRGVIDLFLAVRRDHAHGPQIDYFDHADCIGWTRLGDPAHPPALAVIMSDGPGNSKWMNVARPGKAFADVTGHVGGTVNANAVGWAEFRCGGGGACRSGWSSRVRGRALARARCSRRAAVDARAGGLLA